jgi:16S rRNA C1402 (ribose-2'-O) methylase RsmI
MEIKEKVEHKKQILIFRELTKMYEEIIRTDFENLEVETAELKAKGEFTILLQ